MTDKKIYFVGEKVVEAGEYICVPCGYKINLKVDEQFPECVSCLKSQKDVDMEAVSDEGTWEKVS